MYNMLHNPCRGPFAVGADVSHGPAESHLMRCHLSCTSSRDPANSTPVQLIMDFMSWARQDLPEDASLQQVSTSGWVKAAAGTLRWSSTCGRPHMFSTALMPCAEAACASMNLPAHALRAARTLLCLACRTPASRPYRTLISLLSAELSMSIQATAWQRQIECKPELLCTCEQAEKRQQCPCIGSGHIRQHMSEMQQAWERVLVVPDGLLALASLIQQLVHRQVFQ